MGVKGQLELGRHGPRRDPVGQVGAEKDGGGIWVRPRFLEPLESGRWRKTPSGEAPAPATKALAEGTPRWARPLFPLPLHGVGILSRGEAALPAPRTHPGFGPALTWGILGIFGP